MEARIELESVEEESLLFGPRDRYRKMLTKRFPVEIVSRKGLVKIIGDHGAVEKVHGLLNQGLAVVRSSESGKLNDSLEGLFTSEVNSDQAIDYRDVLAQGVRPRSSGQSRYVESLSKNVISLVFGPAGTGKTFLAVASAVAALRRGSYRKMILARPAVEAGESLGYLPGDMQAKVNPYLRPLYDALYSLLDPNQVRRYLETDVIEIVPLAYMRGRTLDRAFIILDEAQNTTSQQMKMFLTRLGEGSRMVVTGDATQTDLPSGTGSGLAHCIRILGGIQGIGIVELEKGDIIRHPLVGEIVQAYEDDVEGRGKGRPSDSGAGRPARRES